MSTYEAKIVPFNKSSLEIHPDAQKLILFNVPDTLYKVCIAKEDWLDAEGNPKEPSALYLEPDSILNRTILHYVDEFGWIYAMADDKPYRVKAKRLRGVNSFGLLTKTPYGCEVGENVWEKLGLTRWNPPEPGEQGGKSQMCKGPQRDFSKYDVESFAKYNKAFEDGEPIIAMQKINGQNMRVCCQDEQIYVGSRSFWKKELDTCDFWRGYRSVPGLENLAKQNPHLCVFGECYGNVSKMREDCPEGQRRFRAFDIYDINRNCWLDFSEFYEICAKYEVPICPIIYRGPLSPTHLMELVEQDSALGKHCMEGVVIVPEKERWHPKLGRVKAKIVSCRYFELK